MRRTFTTHKLGRIEHAVFWLFMFFFVFDYHFLQDNWAEAIGSTLLELLTYAVIIYLNLSLLIPTFLEKGRKGSYLASLASVVATYVFTMRTTGWETYFYDIGGWRNVFSMVLNTTLFLLISSLYWYFKQWRAERERQLALRGEKLEAELKFLRSQISPHFIFNTLNNIYALSLEKHENTAPMVAKLSGILRYVLYENGDKSVILKKETEIMRQYIELFLLKKPRSQNVDFFVEGNPIDWKIAPMLLVSIVENALKHSGLEHDEHAFVKIHAHILEDGNLTFFVENSNYQVAPMAEPGGIGLPSLRRQLEIKYPGEHQLEIDAKVELFTVCLRLKLEKT